MKMDSWLIFYDYIDGKYELSGSGKNIVPTSEHDKILPVQEHVARQANKLIYDGQKLRLKEGETLLSIDELNRQQKELDIKNGVYLEEEPKPKLIEVEL